MEARGARVNGRHAGRIVARSTHGRPRPCGCFLIVSRVPASVLFCLVIAIADGDTLTARCGPPSAPRKMHVRIAAIDYDPGASEVNQTNRLKLLLGTLFEGNNAANA